MGRIMEGLRKILLFLGWRKSIKQSFTEKVTFDLNIEGREEMVRKKKESIWVNLSINPWWNHLYLSFVFCFEHSGCHVVTTSITLICRQDKRSQKTQGCWSRMLLKLPSVVRGCWWWYLSCLFSLDHLVPIRPIEHAVPLCETSPNVWIWNFELKWILSFILGKI